MFSCIVLTKSSVSAGTLNSLVLQATSLLELGMFILCLSSVGLLLVTGVLVSAVFVKSPNRNKERSYR